MVEDRPSDWDWVKATYECTASVMFGRLMAMAAQNVQQRNKQLGRDAFKLIEINGIQFAVSKEGSALADRFFFKITDGLDSISVRTPKGETLYTVGLTDNGACKLRRDGTELDPWQVLKAALEPLLFG